MPSNYNKLSKSPPFFRIEDFSEKWEVFIDTLTHYCQRVKIYREKLLPNKQYCLYLESSPSTNNFCCIIYNVCNVIWCCLPFAGLLQPKQLRGGARMRRRVTSHQPPMMTRYCGDGSFTVRSCGGWRVVFFSLYVICWYCDECKIWRSCLYFTFKLWCLVAKP